jgi:HlyD family secretion protein
VQEGQRVERGAVLAVLDNEPVLLAVVELARAQVTAREASLGQALTSARAGRGEAQATLARAEEVSARAGRELARLEALQRDGVGTAQGLDLQRSARDEAEREVARGRATLSRYGKGSVSGQADVLVAARQIDVAKAELARAQAELEKAYIRAPLAGTVLTVHARSGEKPGARGLMTLGDLDRMKVEVEVYQTQIGEVAPGNPVTCEAEALPGRLAGVVSKVGLEVGRQTMIDMAPAASTDARVVKVTVELDEASAKAARRYSNLQVVARVRGGP